MNKIKTVLSRCANIFQTQTFDTIRSDIMTLITSELESLNEIKVFTGPSKNIPEISFTQISINNNLFIEGIKNGDTSELKIFRDHKLLSSAKLSKDQYVQLMTLFLDFAFIKIQKTGINLLQTTLESINNSAKPNSVQNEQKSREWLRVTMIVYKKALEKITMDPNLILEFSLQLNLFEASPILIFKSYNLFWQMSFLDNAFLRVLFYNEKNSENSQEDLPSLSGDFYHQKNQIWDELINTLTAINHAFCDK